MRQIEEASATLLKTMQFQVPRKFDSRISWSVLSKLLSKEGKKAMDYCKAWAETPDRAPGPLLMGKTGTFKTHLLWATAKEINDRAHKRVHDHCTELKARAAHRIDSGDLVFAHDFNSNIPRWPSYSLVTTDGAEIAHEVRASVERRNLDDVIARYRHDSWEPTKCALLVDDVEVMKLSDWLHEELYRVFDYRYQQALPTFVATNLNPEELRKHLGDRIARRILHMTEPFTL
jgi:DNA replication protein DnaC